MGNYLGVKCPACCKKFAAADDIVVCPICGAPHHRECYMQQGECVFTADHISGKEWRPPENESADEHCPTHRPTCGQSRAKSCSRCGSASPAEALFCQICGQSLGAPNSHTGEGQKQNPWQGGYGQGPGRGPMGQDTGCYEQAHTYNPYVRGDYDPYAGVEQNEAISDIPARDVAMFIGRSYSYFLPRFHHLERTGRVLQPNLCAGLFNFFYYFYRRMYVIGAAMLAVFLVCLTPLFLLLWELLPMVVHEAGLAYLPEASAQTNWQAAEMYSRMFTIALVLNFISSIIISMFANWVYHKQVVAKIREVMHEFRGSSDYRLMLPRVGGVDRISVVLVGALLFLGVNVVFSVMVFSSNLL